MKALALGETGKLNDMVDQLNDVVKNFPKSEVKQPASEILALINKNNKNIPSEMLLTKTPQEIEVQTNEDQIYEEEDKSNFYYVVVLKSKGIDANRLKFNLSNFNIDNYPVLDFSITAVLLNNDYQLIIVKSMESKKIALNYYNNILNYKDDIFKDYPDYRHFMITASNYAVFYKDQDVDKYLKYFSKHFN
jgi:hypothetical protein